MRQKSENKGQFCHLQFRDNAAACSTCEVLDFAYTPPYNESMETSMLACTRIKTWPHKQRDVILHSFVFCKTIG